MLIMDGRVFDRLEELCKVSVEAKETLSISQKAWQYGIEKGIDIEQHRSWFPILPEEISYIRPCLCYRRNDITSRISEVD